MRFPAAAQFASTPPAINRIGRFHIIQELGRGTLGCVYLGHDPVIARDIAVKTFRPDATPLEKSKYEQQFINEARAAGRLSHPNIATIYDASSENGTTYIAMEYLQGEELSKLLESGYHFAPHEVASIIWKIADALDHAHKHGVVHRDIKPANIFMVEGNQPKLVDFGIARSPNRLSSHRKDTDLDLELDQSHTLFNHNVLGTPNYMSPEQANSQPVDARADIYSLGAVMYEMLVGRKPFETEDADSLLQQVARKTPPSPHQINPDLPVALSQIVMKAMNKRPEKRYDDAEKMALDIKRYLVRERRARRRMQIPVETLTQSDPGTYKLERYSLYLVGFAALVGAVAVAGIIFMR